MMGKELEVKVLHIDPEKMEQKLIAVGAKKVKEEEQENIVFDTRDIFEKKKTEGYLRIRETINLQNGEKNFSLTLKKRKFSKRLRNNIEIETHISDKEAMVEILGELGFEIVHRGKKHRTSYLYEDLLFEIDIWDKDTYPEPYMEIEVKKEEDLNRAISLLNLNQNDITNKSLGILRSKYYILDDKETKKEGL